MRTGAQPERAAVQLLLAFPALRCPSALVLLRMMRWTAAVIATTSTLFASAIAGGHPCDLLQSAGTPW